MMLGYAPFKELVTSCAVVFSALSDPAFSSVFSADNVEVVVATVAAARSACAVKRS